MPVSTIQSISIMSGFVLLSIGLYITWKRKGPLGLTDIIELTIYSFVSGASVGVFINATYYALWGEIFPGESMQSLIQIIEIGAVVLAIGSFYVYVRKVRSRPEDQK